jgi:hypothetical protein
VNEGECVVVFSCLVSPINIDDTPPHLRPCESLLASKTQLFDNNNDNIQITSCILCVYFHFQISTCSQPVVGNSGFIPPEPGFLQGLRKLCDEHNTLLVFDEVRD